MGIVAGLFAMTFWGTAIFLAAIASRKLGNVITLFWMQAFGFLKEKINLQKTIGILAIVGGLVLVSL